MAILLNDNLRIAAPKPVDTRFGPFHTASDALNALIPSERYIGLTVAVSGEGFTTKEYWFKQGINNGDFVLKAPEDIATKSFVHTGFLPLSGGNLSGDLSTTGKILSAGVDLATICVNNGLNAIRTFVDNSNVLNTITIVNGLIMNWQQVSSLPWLLNSGTWDDNGAWDDTAVWNDGSTPSWLLGSGSWNDAGIWDDTVTWNG